tara:strand:- start:248 stop:628 length:381 start_codon:yes stop_codon:yes gene_type:complete
LLILKMDNKLKESYKTISEVVNILNINNPNKQNNQSYTIRYWETQFKQIKPIKINNRRYYDHKNINILLRIQYLLKNQGMTINGVKKILSRSNLNIDEKEKKIISSLDIKFRLSKISNLLKSIKKN